MIRTFTKGKLRKKIIYVKFYPRQCNAWNHVVSIHGSDGKGRILIERERQEEFSTERQAKERFRQWAAELIGDGWECLEGYEVEARDESEVEKEEYDKKVQKRMACHETRKCKMCGAEFVACCSTQCYCSRRCKEAYKSKRNRRFEPEPRKCEWCGSEFMATRKLQLYCSNKCCVAACSRRHWEKIKQQRKK